MISKTIEQALNTQIQSEFFAAQLYLSMAGYCYSQNLKGFASWMKLQASEEREHAMKFFDHIVDRGGNVELHAIDAATPKLKSPLDMMRAALAHEKKVTGQIHKLYNLAVKEKDYAAQVMLQWFVTEQIEEEAQAEEVVKKLELIGEKSSAILYLDKELGKRGS
ncbi:MAG: ferritin [Deltaproteobacteria bacterium]|nr:ferritin [Deltaproteobacteria bacterium]